ncbi:ABC transporter permease subunit [Spirochaeta isovalerica]|uniref:Putative aldouronate transport system permease protein n=1 Tax=Spirochaeta isovalerica TaxID=150 RepID=A0A841RAR9_9SPIO|nr:putative aldouronate transport system permease protein [Spirochaeta isovalerica]
MNRPSGKMELFWSTLVAAAVILICAVMLYPFLFTISASISDPDMVIRNQVTFFPKGPLSFEGYKILFKNERIWQGYANTIFYTLFGTGVNLAITVLAAYPMSRRGFNGYKFINIFISLTMFISATGMMIPLFLVVRGLNLLDTRLAILIVFAAFPYYIILLRSFFQQMPEEMFEAARLDGANEFTILLKIVLPLSGAALATIGLYYGINRWNGYFWAMIFLRDETKHPLQVVLRELIVLASMGEEMDASLNRGGSNAEVIKYGAIVLATLPIAVIYPFIQKYFVKGATLGSVKG